MEPESRWKQMQYSLMKEVNADGIKKSTKKKTFLLKLQRQTCLAYRDSAQRNTFSETQGQIKWARKKFGRRKVKNAKKNPWGCKFELLKCVVFCKLNLTAWLGDFFSTIKSTCLPWQRNNTSCMYLLKINAINADIFSANDSTSCIPMLYKMTAKSDALFIFVHLEELDNIVIRITIVTFGILFTLARKMDIHYDN